MIFNNSREQHTLFKWIFKPQPKTLIIDFKFHLRMALVYSHCYQNTFEVINID